MMSKKAQREFFLLLSVIGIFLTMILIAHGFFSTIDKVDGLTSRGVTVDSKALIALAKHMMPISFSGSAVVIGTYFSYRRYHKLAFSQPK